MLRLNLQHAATLLALVQMQMHVILSSVYLFIYFVLSASYMEKRLFTTIVIAKLSLLFISNILTNCHSRPYLLLWRS